MRNYVIPVLVVSCVSWALHTLFAYLFAVPGPVYGPSTSCRTLVLT